MMKREVQVWTQLLVIGWIVFFPSSALAQDPVLNLELMEYLAGDPTVNDGSDGVLVQLPGESTKQIHAASALYTRQKGANDAHTLKRWWQVPSD